MDEQVENTDVHEIVLSFLRDVLEYKSELIDSIPVNRKQKALDYLKQIVQSPRPISQKSISDTLGMSKSEGPKVGEALDELLGKFCGQWRIGLVIHLKVKLAGQYSYVYFSCTDGKNAKTLDSASVQHLLEEAAKKLGPKDVDQSQEALEKDEEQWKAELRQKLDEEARKHIHIKLHGEGLDDYRPLKLDIGSVPEAGQTDTVLHHDTLDHNRLWDTFECKELETSEGMFLLSTETGCGKTTFLRQLQRDIIANTDLIPLFLEAADLEGLKYRKCDVDGFLSNLATLFPGHGQQKSVFKFLKSHLAEIVFLVDGLDQITGCGTEYENVVNALLSVIDQRLIIGTRPFAAVPYEANAGIAFLKLRPFSGDDVRAYFGDKCRLVAKLCKACPELLRIPMLAYMVRCLITEGKDKNIKCRADLYREFMDYLFEDYHPNNLVMSESVRGRIRNACSELSFKAIANQEVFLQRIPLSFAIESTPAPVEIDHVLKYGLADIVNKGGKYLYFSHQSFQEYLAAEYASQNVKAIGQIIEEKWNPKWYPVISFLVGLEGEDIIRTVLMEKDNPIHAKLFFSAKLATENNVSLDLKGEISERLERLFENPLFAQRAKYYWIFIDDRKSLNRFQELLESADTVREGLSVLDCNEVQGIIDKRIASIIVDKLSDDNEEIVSTALHALKMLKNNIDSSIVAGIAARLNDENKGAVCAALRALGVLSDTVDGTVVTEIAAKLDDDNEEVVVEALQAIGELADTLAGTIITKVVHKLSDQDKRVVITTLMTLARLRNQIDRSVAKHIADRLNYEKIEDDIQAMLAIQRLAKKLDGVVRARVIHKLNDEDKRAVHTALWFLQKWPDWIDDTVFGQIVDKLDDGHEGIVAQALKVVGTLSDSPEDEVMAKVVAKLNDKSVEIVRAALSVLGCFPDRIDNAIIDQILDKVHDDNTEVAYSAVRVVAKFPSKLQSEVITRVIHRLNAEKKHTLSADLVVVQEIADKVDGLVVKETIDGLVDDLNDTDKEVVVAALRAIDKLAHELDPVQIVKKVAHKLNDESTWVVSVALSVLETFHHKIDDTVFGQILDKLNDEDELVVSLTAKVLFKLRNRLDRSIVERLIGIRNEPVYDLLQKLYESGTLELLCRN